MLSQDQKELIEKQKQIAILAQRKSRYEYLGLLSDYQLNRPSLLFELEYTKLNPYQHFLFKRVLHGLNIYRSCSGCVSLNISRYSAGISQAPPAQADSC